jgi:hypothetical protein
VVPYSVCSPVPGFSLGDRRPLLLSLHSLVHQSVLPVSDRVPLPVTLHCLWLLKSLCSPLFMFLLSCCCLKCREVCPGLSHPPPYGFL